MGDGLPHGPIGGEQGSDDGAGGPVLRLLARGLELWLRQQCEAIDELQIQLEGSAVHPENSAAHSRSFVVVMGRLGRRPVKSAMAHKASESGACSKYLTNARCFSLVLDVASKSRKSWKK